ncbi:MAG: hypothetical protein A2W90_10195 [Bacteroidetes bacterium GWF2_42_66]|nr:MAG: hypothetical protein A2W92_15535 [Bacteroidetes bacterium GWA2_42_15]OFX97471.1 MAG: hypothetical protein A2W89_01210 [Bacteroidetes bacterium GWE2_42_39]OFY43834.1 MAG: hypothetical protein A2W90_10195 [Bacteroidetes bacterium GWF2_42_66]HBL76179.1 hypothetical protein [Prolixibacteraceae bacterium]HCR91960.1 hypothetical protein [Prolixibacteraceae bacterium]
MIKKIQIALLFSFFIIAHKGHAQTNVSEQIQTIPSNLSMYIDGYLHDLITPQGIATLNNLHTSGKVLGQWELSLSVNLGAGITGVANTIHNNYSDNFELIGNQPSLFGEGTEGTLFFQVVDEETRLPYYDPFTGKKLGFGMPLLPGAGLGVGVSPSVMPVVSLGLGYATEVSVSVLPGALKASSKGLTGDFEITKDMMASFGIRHDVFHWVPWMSKRNFHLTLGAAYSTMSLESAVGDGLLGEFESTGSDYVKATNNLTGMEYGFSSLGFEAMLSKKLSFIDLSLFASTNQSDYFMKTKGSIEVDVANDFYQGSASGYETTTLDKLVDIEGTTKRFLYGAALQFNMGRVHWGFKAALSDELYVSTSIGVKILKN